MRPLIILAIILICLGMLALVSQGLNFLAPERAGSQKALAYVLPIVGIVGVAIGVVLLVAGGRSGRRRR